MPKKRKTRLTPAAPGIDRFRNRSRALFLLVLAVFVLLTPGQNIYTTAYAGLRLVRKNPAGTNIKLPDPAPYPVNRSGVWPGDTVTAFAVSVRDADSGVFMYEKNAVVPMSPASTSKIMTALVALDLYSLDDTVTVKNILNEGQLMGLIEGERVTVENLLYGIIVHSGNDAAYALAEYHPEGVSGFVRAMNEKAQSLHLDGSIFRNPMGFDDEGQRMTAHDLALLAGVALENKVIMKMAALPAITVSDVTYTHFHTLKNVNQLLGRIPGVAGLKTGWTQEAGENLVTLVERNGKRVIIVVLNSADRFTDTSYLIDWVFSAHQWETHDYLGG